MKKIFKILIILVIVFFVVPKIVMASWWNPFSWNIRNIFTKPHATKINPSLETSILQIDKQNTKDSFFKNNQVTGEDNYQTNKITEPSSATKPVSTPTPTSTPPQVRVQTTHPSIMAYLEMNKPYLSKTNVTVIVKDIKKVEDVGSYKYTISYEQENKTTDKELDEGTFKMFFEDGTSLNQYGSFDKLFPNGKITKIYTFQILRTQKPFCIEFNNDDAAGLEGSFFKNQPAAGSLKWKIVQ